MESRDSIKKVKELYVGQKIDLPEEPGIYAFWWIGDKKELLDSKTNLILSGPNKKGIPITFGDWWPSDLDYPCLYVGKSTNIKRRFSLHIKNKSKARLHSIDEEGNKERAKTTSCQLRYGIEHIFRDEEYPLEIIHNKVGFSYKTDFPKQAVVERFYTEDLYIGTWRPWFNIDSER